MADNQEKLEFLSQLEIQLSVSGVPDAAGALREIAKIDKDLIKDVGKLKQAYGGFDGAIKAIIKRHKERATASARAGKIEQTNIQKLSKGYRSLANDVRGYSSEIVRASMKMVAPASLGEAIKTTLDYNKSLLATSASVNRLGIGAGLLQKSLERVAKETSLTRKETVALFDKYQEGMRFVSLQQFEGMLKRIQSIVGANAQEMDKMQGAIARVSQEYPGLANGLAALEKMGGGMAAQEKAVLQERIRNLYFIGKIGDAQYKQLTSYISGNQQIIGADKARQQEMQASIEAANKFRQQWEKASMAVGKGLLPHLQTLAGFLEKVQDYTKNWKMSLLKIAGIYAGLKIGGGAASALGGMAIRGGGRAAGRVGGGLLRGAGRVGGGLLSGVGRLLGRRGGAVGRLGTTMSGVGKTAGVVAGAGTPVFVTNWPAMLGPAGAMRSTAGGMQGQLGRGGLLGKAKGLFGKGTRLSGLKGIGLGIGLGLGSMATKWGGRKLEEKGFKKTGATLGIAGGGLGIGAGAVTGAGIGTMIFPGVGTAIGGAVGALIGTIKQWGSLKDSFQKLFDKSKKEKEAEEVIKPFEDLSSKIEKELSESLSVKKSLETQKEIDIAKAGEEGLAKMYESISEHIAVKQKALTDAQKIVEQNITAALAKAGYGKGTLKSQQAIVAKLKQEVDKRGDYEVQGGKEQKEADQATLKAAEEKLDKMNKITNEQEENNDALKKATREYNYQSNRLENITTLMAKQKDLVEKISGLYQTQSSYTDSMVEKMSIMGDIDPPKIFEMIEKSLVSLDAEKSARKTLIGLLKMEDHVAAKKAAEEEANSKKNTKANRALFAEFAKLNLAGFSELDTKQAVLEQSMKILDITKQQTAEYGKAGKAYDRILSLTEAQATGAGLLVQLADNYAIGVGASAKMRMQEYRAIEDVKSQLRDQLAVQQEAYARDVSANGVTKDNIELRKQMVLTQNALTQKTIQQASIVKSMRDAWVSAISAMNTGMGSFTEIIMNAETNTAQIQRLDGAVRSSVSGAYALRDAFGRVIEDVGFQGSEVMNQFGDITARGGPRTRELSYSTPLTEQVGDVRQIMEAAQRGDVRAMTADMEAANKIAVSKGLQAQAAAGHKYTLSVEAGQDSFVKDIAAAGKRTEQNWAKPKKGGFDMRGGITSTYMGPPVNKKSDPIPVFVVNFGDASETRAAKRIRTLADAPRTGTPSAKAAEAAAVVAEKEKVVAEKEKVISAEAKIAVEAGVGVAATKKKASDRSQKIAEAKRLDYEAMLPYKQGSGSIDMEKLNAAAGIRNKLGVMPWEKEYKDAPSRMENLEAAKSTPERTAKKNKEIEWNRSRNAQIVERLGNELKVAKEAMKTADMLDLESKAEKVWELTEDKRIMSDHQAGFNKKFPANVNASNGISSEVSEPVAVSTVGSANVVLENITLHFADIPGLNALGSMLTAAINEQVNGQNVAMANAIGQYQSSAS